MKKASILKLTNQEATVKINELGLPEGSAEEQIETLLVHFGFKAGDSVED